MSLMAAYSNSNIKTPIHALIISHFDGHGVAFAAARARILRQQGEEIEIYSQFPVTGPQGLSSGQLRQAIEQLNVAPQRFEVIDIPIDVRNPDAAIRTLADLLAKAPVYYYDHHETDVPFLLRLHRAGIFASVFGDNVAMAVALELLNDPVAKELAIIGMTADRDSSVLKLVSKEEIERSYLPIANRLDVLVRNPRIINASTQGELAKILAETGVAAIPTNNLEYPPERLAIELQSRIHSEGTIAILVNWSDAQQQLSQWIPKTLEQLLLLRGKFVAVSVVPAYNPRTKIQEGYDVRVLRYWLAPADIPTPEELARDLVVARAITGNVVGHADYISLRYASLEEALRTAEIIYKRYEGQISTSAHLVNDRIVAEALQRDFKSILEKIQEILERQQQMYKEYLELKRKQVELLERTQRHEYD